MKLSKYKMVIIINYIKMTWCIQAFYTRWLTYLQQAIFENRSARVLFGLEVIKTRFATAHRNTRLWKMKNKSQKLCAIQNRVAVSEKTAATTLKDWRKKLRLPAHRECLYRGKRYGRRSLRQWCSPQSGRTGLEPRVGFCR